MNQCALAHLAFGKSPTWPNEGLRSSDSFSQSHDSSSCAPRMAGDGRLLEKLRREELIPLGSRIRTRLATEFASRDELALCLEHLFAGAGNASSMTPPLRQTLCDHAAGNYRILTTMAAELLAVAAQRDLSVLDEKLYLGVFAPAPKPTPRRVAQGK